MTTSIPERTIAIDEDGYFVSGDTRWTEASTGRELFENLKIAENGALVSSTAGTPVVVEAFDAPLVAQSVDNEDGLWHLTFPYHFEDTFDPKTLHVDEWDRFHGTTTAGLPFVFKRSAQAAFFDAADEFDDDSITLNGERYEIPPTYTASPDVSTSRFWTHIYETEGQPRWDLGEPAEALKDMLPRLKLTKSRILVLGCGEGHDAAFFAREGHLVTAVDLSPEAIRRAKARYGDVQNLRFLLADAFSLDSQHDAAYDVIFEHTFYCAIDPRRRQDLVRRWNRWLSPGGMLMGVFFAVEKREGPPYGGTEWELRERLRKNFQFIFWGRWKASKAGRQGKELFVYARKLTPS